MKTTVSRAVTSQAGAASTQAAYAAPDNRAVAVAQRQAQAAIAASPRQAAQPRLQAALDASPRQVAQRQAAPVAQLMRIRNPATGDEREHPDGEAIPEGYQQVGASRNSRRRRAAAAASAAATPLVAAATVTAPASATTTGAGGPARAVPASTTATGAGGPARAVPARATALAATPARATAAAGPGRPAAALTPQQRGYPYGFASEQDFRDKTRVIAEQNRDGQVVVSGSSVTGRSFKHPERAFRRGGNIRDNSDIDMALINPDLYNDHRKVEQGDTLKWNVPRTPGYVPTDRDYIPQGFPVAGSALSQAEQSATAGMGRRGHKIGIRVRDRLPRDRPHLVRSHTPEHLRRPAGGRAAASATAAAPVRAPGAGSATGSLPDAAVVRPAAATTTHPATAAVVRPAAATTTRPAAAAVVRPSAATTTRPATVAAARPPEATVAVRPPAVPASEEVARPATEASDVWLRPGKRKNKKSSGGRK